MRSKSQLTSSSTLAFTAETTCFSSLFNPAKILLETICSVEEGFLQFDYALEDLFVQL